MPIELPTVDTLDFDALSVRCETLLAQSAGWSPARRDGTIRVSRGRLPQYPWTLYRIDMTTAATATAYARFIADDGLDHLGEWNREFVRGEVLSTLWDRADDTAWLLRVHYATPPVLANREYIYALRRTQSGPESYLITYHSVASDLPVEPGFGRATLVDTVHTCHTDADTGLTTVAHVLSGDLRGSIPLWVQNTFFAGGIVAANLRDGQAQRRLLG